MPSVRFNDSNFDEIAAWQKYFRCRLNMLLEYKQENVLIIDVISLVILIR